MFVKQVILFALATLLPAISAQNGVTCQTSSGSPSTEDATSVINQVGGDGSCPQTNGAASDCTTLVSHKTAAISVCGAVDTTDSVLSCEEVASYVNEIQQTCLSDGKAGGTYTVGPSKRVELIHS